MDIRQIIRQKLDDIIRSKISISSLIDDNALFIVGQPVGKLRGAQAIEAGWFDRLRSSFSGCYRRDIICIGSKNYIKSNQFWVACSTNYTGNFEQEFFGVAPSKSLAMLRAGEFYRIENDKIVEARIIFDLPDLMQQAGSNPFPRLYGLQHCFPAPATLDGVCPDRQGNGDQSHDVMMRMLRDLISFDPETKSSEGMTGEGGAWHDEMMWYGPAGIGATYKWNGFVKDHREPFLEAFPTREKGDTVCQLGDHNYAGVCGHGMPMKHMGSYFDLPASGKDVLLPVMDFYRVEDGQLIENWVYLDYVDMFSQLGVDLISGDGWP